MQATKQSLKVEEMVDLFYARQMGYDVLRRFFIEEPSREYLSLFIQEKLLDLFPFQKESELIATGVETVREYLSKTNVILSSKDYEELHWDYTRLLIGPFEVPAPPWESVYLRTDRLLFQKTTMDVRRMYKKFGLKAAEYGLEADDHIGLELDFMYRLNSLGIESSATVLDTSVPEIVYLLKEQKSFMDNHLGKFAPAFAKNVREHADTGFYKGMAMILAGFIEMDSSILSELLNIEMIKE
jgi:putative dimethyl sulfoxide reductase chaperone